MYLERKPLFDAGLERGWIGRDKHNLSQVQYSVQ
jgi:hypothetical protein